MASRLARVETMVEEIHHRLLGNGQPGEIDKMKEDISSLKSSRTWVKGVATALGVIITGDLGVHLKAFFKG